MNKRMIFRKNGLHEVTKLRVDLSLYTQNSYRGMLHQNLNASVTLHLYRLQNVQCVCASCRTSQNCDVLGDAQLLMSYNDLFLRIKYLNIIQKLTKLLAFLNKNIEIGQKWHQCSRQNIGLCIFGTFL